MSTIIILVMIAMSAALIFVGIGQRKYRRWGRIAAIQWSVVGLLVLVGQAAYYLVVVNPAIDIYIRELGAGGSLSGVTKGATFVTLFLYLPYPIILLVWAQRPNVIDAMQS